MRESTASNGSVFGTAGMATSHIQVQYGESVLRQVLFARHASLERHCACVMAVCNNSSDARINEICLSQ